MTQMNSMTLVWAMSWKDRLRGLLGTDASWGGGKRALALPGCNSVHTVGMRYALDIAFVDETGTVVRSERNVRPGRLLSCHKAVLTVERPSNKKLPWPEAGIEIGIRNFREINGDICDA